MIVLASEEWPKPISESRRLEKDDRLFGVWNRPAGKPTGSRTAIQGVSLERGYEWP